MIDLTQLNLPLHLRTPATQSLAAAQPLQLWSTLVSDTPEMRHPSGMLMNSPDAGVATIGTESLTASLRSWTTRLKEQIGSVMR